MVSDRWIQERADWHMSQVVERRVEMVTKVEVISGEDKRLQVMESDKF